MSTKSARRQKAYRPVLSGLHLDIAGIVLLAAGLFSLVAIYWDGAGALGTVVRTAFQAVLGTLAPLLALLLMGSGIALLTGKTPTQARSLGIGVFLMLWALAAAFAAPGETGFFNREAAFASGGYLGAFLAFIFDYLFGSARYIPVAALFLIGLVVAINSPMRTFLANANQKSKPIKVSRTKPAPKERVIETVTPNKPIFEKPAIDEPLPVPAAFSPAVPSPEVEDRQPKPKDHEFKFETSKEGYDLPPLTLLNDPIPATQRSLMEMEDNIRKLEATLEEFRIEANVVEVAAGPTITRFEIQLGPGIKVSRITNLADNIAMRLAASQVRVEAPIPGKSAIGVEVPNSAPSPVTLREVAEGSNFLDHPSRLAVCLGKNVAGDSVVADLTKMPHLLIGGSTNSGKSIGLASVIMSLLLRNTPKDVRLVLIDPKRVELSLFNDVPHLMCPVVKDVKQAPGVLRAVWREMDRRYDKFSEAGVRNIDGWNAQATWNDRMSYIVVVIDELADLMIQAAAEVETSICRLAQLARATGIHLVVATQRPSVDVVTGTIKANISSRIAFTVASGVDSKTILDQPGAERLIGRGDMLFLPIDASKPVRIQGCYVSEKEISAVCKFWKDQEKPHFELEPVDEPISGKGSGRAADDGEGNDPLWEDAVRWVAERGQASTSMLQRRFSVGFQRASRLLDTMEENGIVGPRDGPRPREVLLSLSEVEGLFGREPVFQEVGYIEED
jgi:S-DNA-T family DNA segregation ATPase FtsK/SpoIIIE